MDIQTSQLSEEEIDSAFDARLDEIFRLMESGRGNEIDWDRPSSPLIRVFRDEEEEKFKKTGRFIRDTLGAYEEGLKRNQWLLEVKFKDRPNINWAFKEWKRIAEEGGKEEVIQIHLHPRQHQELLSSSPFNYVAGKHERAEH